MNYVFISDLHIKRPDDLAARIFREFCLHSHTLHSDKVIFLGDIFDHVVGNHVEYLKKYQFFFEELDKLLALDKEVVFIEGNHDFHIKELFERYLSSNPRYSTNFRYLRKGETLLLGEEKFYYCHGYEVDYFNKYFRRWYRIYSSKWFKFFINYVLTYNIIMKIADWASKDSKRRGQKTFDFNLARVKYIEGAYELIKEKKVDGVIAGHTHIPCTHKYPTNQWYFNCGFPIRDKKFLSFRNQKFEMVNLEVS